MLFPCVFPPNSKVKSNHFEVFHLSSKSVVQLLMAVFRRKHPDSFHGSIRPLLVLAQMCALLPVKGIFGSKLRFSWKNPIHIYAFIICGVTLFFDVCYTIDNFKTGIRMDVFASTVFYTVCLLTTLFFFEIAINFPEISHDFEQIEKTMSDYGYPKHLGRKANAFLYSFVIFAIVEHGTMAFNNFYKAWHESADGSKSFGYSFYVIHFPAISWRLSYTGIGTILLFWVNAMCTFNWNYLDFFLIVMSMEISTRFALLNWKISQTDVVEENTLFWNKISRDYNEMSLLTKKVDKKFSKVILTSFFSNMYHLSLQLVRSLKINGTLFTRTYFYSSMTYLIMRLLLVLFCIAQINEESKKSAHVLFSLRNPCAEAIRFLHQILTDDIALTGNKFFVVNKKFVVTVIGTVATYQAVLLQFNSLKDA